MGKRNTKSSYSEQTSSSDSTRSSQTQKPRGWTKEQFVAHIQKVLSVKRYFKKSCTYL